MGNDCRLSLHIRLKCSQDETETGQYADTWPEEMINKARALVLYWDSIYDLQKHFDRP